MAIQTINIGNIVNDGLGDDLRTAFQKVNANFTDLNARALVTNSSNVGASGVGIFKTKNVDVFEFKKLVGGTNVTIVDQTDTVQINSPLQQTFGSVIVGNGTDNIEATVANDTFGIKGGTNVTVSLDGRYVKIDAFSQAARLFDDPNPTLNGDLVLNGRAIQGAGSFNGDLTLRTVNGSGIGNLIGNVTGLVHGVDIRDIVENPKLFDFGNINSTIETVFQLILFTTDLELGTITGGSPLVLDFGTIN